MWPQLYEWFALFIKWFHVICGVAWIGASFYFTWLDNSLENPPQWKKDKGIKGDLWAVHGGGFYEVAKYQVGPQSMPTNLHWFKWEAYTTWITGTALMIWMYYFNAAAYLIDPRVMSLTSFQAVSLGLSGIALGVVVYEALMRSPLSRHAGLFCGALIALGALFFYGFTHVFSGRGAFIHMGALMGTIMVNNVFHKIIPGQRKMVTQVAAGEAVDPAPGLEGKRRSIHNNYFTLPVIFLMISNHYPMIYQHSLSWLVGILILVISAYLRHYFNLKHAGKSKPSVLISSSIAMLLLAVFVSWGSVQANKASRAEATASSVATQTTPSRDSALHQQSASEGGTSGLDDDSNRTHYIEIATQIIEQRCTQCHSATPTDDVFTVAPSGAIFDSWQDIERWSPRILARTVESADMPFLNKTNMTDQERQQLKEALSHSH
ncbi:urate hydroxylase PuuD [Vibrio cholerae]